MGLGVMMALYHRDRTGDGQQVEAALLPTAMMLSNAFLIEREFPGFQVGKKDVLLKNRSLQIVNQLAPRKILRRIRHAGKPIQHAWCLKADRFDGSRFGHAQKILHLGLAEFAIPVVEQNVLSRRRCPFGGERCAP